MAIRHVLENRDDQNPKILTCPKNWRTSETLSYLSAKWLGDWFTRLLRPNIKPSWLEAKKVTVPGPKLLSLSYLFCAVSMKLARLFAFEVYPQKGVAEPSKPAGGKIVPNGRIKSTLSQIYMDAGLDKATSIAFKVSNPKTDKYQNTMRNRQFVTD